MTGDTGEPLDAHHVTRAVTTEVEEIALEEALRRFDAAVVHLLNRDAYLIVHDVHERAITHKLAEYLQPLFPGWNVDCEYNRNMHEPKRVHLPQPDDPDARRYVSIYPDIIVHQRGSNDRNLLIVEAKKAVDGRFDGEERDRRKLEAYAQDLGYKVGVFVVFDSAGGRVTCTRTCYSRGLWSLAVSIQV